jgi:ribose-phosphate pyrophosphokinase
VQRLNEAPVKEVVATNTIALPADKYFEKLTMISVAPLLGEVIRRIHLGISVGELFNE